MYDSFSSPRFEYLRSADQDATAAVHHPVIIAGAGPVGLAAAINLARSGIRVLLLEQGNTVCSGSRAVCYSKRMLDICDRLGVSERILQKGVSWSNGKILFRGDEVCEVALIPAKEQRHTCFVNLQQYYLEEILIDKLNSCSNAELRWGNRIADVRQADDAVLLSVSTPEGYYRLSCDYLIACDGAGSLIRNRMGLDGCGKVFQNRYLIADIVLHNNTFAPQRWFWFEPPFHDGDFVLMQPQADQVWRVDFDLGWQADPQQERKPEKVIPRLEALLGADAEFELESTSVYTFNSRQIARMQDRRILFAGDAAHQLSPFGSRGVNSGFEDIDNLSWKLAAVLQGQCPESLLSSYDEERSAAAAEHISHAGRSTDFISPQSGQSRANRNAVLELAKDYPFARAMINSGRLADVPLLKPSSLNTPDSDHFDNHMQPGAVCEDAPVKVDGRDDYLLGCLGEHFTLLLFTAGSDIATETLAQLDTLTGLSLPVTIRIVTTDAAADQGEYIKLQDYKGLVRQRYDASPGCFYLIRPDQIVAARYRQFNPDVAMQACNRAMGNT